MIPPILGILPICEERLLGFTTKFFKIANLKIGTLRFQPITNASIIANTSRQLSDSKLSTIIIQENNYVHFSISRKSTYFYGTTEI